MMKKFLKSLSLVMALVMCFTMVFTAAVSADGATPTITFGVKDSVEPGTVSITVDAANFADVAGVQGEITVGGLTDAAVVAGTIDNVVIDAGVISFAEEGEANDEGTKITMAGGTLFTITGTAVEGTNITLAWTAAEIKACDTAEKLLTLDYADKTVEVKAPVVGPEVLPGVRIGATLFIQEKYGWRFAVVASEVAAYDHYDLVATFNKYDDNYNLTTDEVVFTVADKDDSSTATYDFYFYANTAAYELDLDVDLQVRLYDSENNLKAVSNVVTTSIADKLLAAMPTAGDAMKTLYMDLINYGAAAQAFFAVDGSDLASAVPMTEGFDDYLSFATQTTTGIIPTSSKNIVNNSYNIGGTVVVGASNSARFNILVPSSSEVDGLKVKVTYTNLYGTPISDGEIINLSDMAIHNATVRYFVYDKIALYDMGTTINVELLDASDATLLTFDYSVDQFISDKLEDATYTALTVPMAKFSISARSFFS